MEPMSSGKLDEEMQEEDEDEEEGDDQLSA